jgi:rhamnosyltransferase
MKQFMLHRWEEVNGVGLHDWFFYAWYRANGLLWFIDDEWHMRYRQHGVNQVGANQGFSAIRSRFRLLRSGWYGTEVARIAVLVSSPSDRIARLAMAKSWWVHLGLLLYIGSLRRRMRDRVVLMAIIIFGVF